MTSSLRLAIAQMNPTIGALAANAQKLLFLARQAVAQQVDLLITPELALCGYPPKDLLLDPSFVQTMTEQLSQLAAACPDNLNLLVGTVCRHHQAPQTGEKGLWNSAVWIQNCSIKRYFHKCLLPTYDVFDEHRYFASAERSEGFTLKGVNIGVTLCEDVWNDEGFWGQRHYGFNPVAALHRQGMDLIVNLSASPYSLGKPAFRERLLSFSAQSLKIPIVYANQVGGNDDLIFDGASFAVDRQGQVVSRAPSFAEALHIVDWHLGTKDFQLSVLTPQPPCLEAELWSALVLGVQDYCHKCGFTKIVLGLSGGIDSALVAAIAAEALGPTQVLGVLMPSPYSSSGSVSDAQELANNLGIATEILPIGPLMASFDSTLAPLWAQNAWGVTEENLQSRIRGTLLMAIANKFGHLLLTTGNKSELAVGYCTLYGDMNGGLGAISDLAKTQVLSLCRWLNREHATIPPQILTKPPSAELRPGQVDQDSLPPYEILDAILERLIYQHQSRSEIVAAGYEPATVAQIFTLVRRAEFKRRQAAPGLKVTDRAFGTGWRMPIAAHPW